MTTNGVSQAIVRDWPIILITSLMVSVFGAGLYILTLDHLIVSRMDEKVHVMSIEVERQRVHLQGLRVSVDKLLRQSNDNK